jgi:short-subunit dehydrogenase involved in D-alanine esterification of teichoic acids
MLNMSRITTTYPSLDCLFLNAGFQWGFDFTSPSSADLKTATDEMTTNYLSPLHTITHFLPHLISLSPRPTCIALVSSGLAMVPLPRCPNYCASKAALHSLAWSLRFQMQGKPETEHVRVVEVLPPAVETELHPRQGLGQIGVPLDEYADDCWKALREGEEDEVLVHQVFTEGIDDKKREVFEMLSKKVFH